jgi:hypothetical protein
MLISRSRRERPCPLTRSKQYCKLALAAPPVENLHPNLRHPADRSKTFARTKGLRHPSSMRSSDQSLYHAHEVRSSLCQHANCLEKWKSCETISNSLNTPTFRLDSLVTNSRMQPSQIERGPVWSNTLVPCGADVQTKSLTNCFAPKWVLQAICMS